MSVAAMLRARNWMLALAVLLLIAASFMPPIEMRRTVFNHLVVFDITQSMNVADQLLDGKQVSRLSYAKHQLASALGELPCGSRVGLGVFTSRRTLLLLAPAEVCANRYELEQAIAQVDTRMAWEQASVIARGLYTAIEVAAEMTPSPSLIFISDGHTAPPVADTDVPAFEKPSVPIQGAALGVGGLTPQPIPRSDRSGKFIGWWSPDDVVQRTDVSSQEHMSALHEGHLIALAGATDLQYARIDTASAFVRAFTDPALQREQVVLTDVRWFPALLAGLLIVAFFMPSSVASRKLFVGRRQDVM